MRRRTCALPVEKFMLPKHERCSSQPGKWCLFEQRDDDLGSRCGLQNDVCRCNGVV